MSMRGDDMIVRCKARATPHAPAQDLVQRIRARQLGSGGGSASGRTKETPTGPFSILVLVGSSFLSGPSERISHHVQSCSHVCMWMLR